jgi:hypothetical protein
MEQQIISQATVDKLEATGPTFFTAFGKHVFWCGKGSKAKAIAEALAQGHSLVVGWTKYSKGRVYGSFKDHGELVSLIHAPGNPLELSDLQGLYHVTVDSQLFAPYFDLEYTLAQEAAYPWLSLEGIQEDIKAACWHMCNVSLADQDFVVMDASGLDSKGEYKFSYHVLIRPEGAPLAASKETMAELVSTCLGKYAVKDLANPTIAKHVIDPSVYRPNHDYRMVFQGKPGGERPLLPVTHQDQSPQFFMPDYLPPKAQTLTSKLPSSNPPALPAQLAPLASPEVKEGAASTSTPRSVTARPGGASIYDEQFSFLTPAGKLKIVHRLLEAAGISDITPAEVQGSRVGCLTDKRNGRACKCTEGERHVSNNVYLFFSRNGSLYYQCLAPGCCFGPTPRVAIGSWVECLSNPHALFTPNEFEQLQKQGVTDPFALYIQTLPTRVVDLGALEDSIRAMCTRPMPKSPSYDTLKAVFELGNFVVGKPYGLASLNDPMADGDVLYIRNQKEFKDSFKWLQYIVRKEGKPDKNGNLSPPVDMEVEFTTSWLKDTQHRHYDHVDFLPPPCQSPRQVFNLWDGFDAQKWEVESSGDLWGYRELLGLSCSNDAGLMHAKEVYLAHLIQQPGVNPQAGIVVKSYEQGSGKDTEMYMMRHIVGDKYVAFVTDPTNQLFSEHAVALKHKLLIHVSESEKLRKHDQALKGIMTSDTVEVNEKYVKQYSIRNMARWLAYGNEAAMVQIGRRWLATEQSAARVGDAAYWVKMYAYLDDKSNLKAIFDHLRQVDLQAISTAGSIQAVFARHTTTAQLEAAVAACDNLTKWAVSQVEAWQARSRATDQDRVSKDDLFESYFNWGVQNRIWKDDGLPDLNMPQFRAELIHRYSQSQSVVPQDKNCGPKRGAGWLITWEKWRDQLVRHNYMTKPQQGCSTRGEGKKQETVQEEAVEEVGPTPLTRWLDQEGASGASDSEDDGWY